MFVLFTRRHFKSNNKFEYNNFLFEFICFWPLDVTRSMLQKMPAGFDFVKSLTETLYITKNKVNHMVKQELLEALCKTYKKIA